MSKPIEETADLAQMIAYLDCRGGVSGNLLLSALLDSGVSLDEVKQQLAHLPGYERVLIQEFAPTKGLQGRAYIVQLRPAGERRFLAEVLGLLRSSRLPQRIRMRAQSVVRRLQEAEVAVYGENVAELSPLDAELALFEVVSVLSALELAGIERVYASVLPLTGGLLQHEGQNVSLPQPVTLEILRRVQAPWRPSAVAGELVTPIGAALLAEIARFETPTLTIERTGYGYVPPQTGVDEITRSLRISIGHLLGEERRSSKGVEVDRVSVIETHIDTMTGELLGALLDRLLEAGALDVGYTPLQMKKNRPGTRLTVICPEALGEQLALLLLRETNTLGVRIQQVERRKATRWQEIVETPFGAVRVKLKRLGDEIIGSAPEYEDCLRIAKEQQRPLQEVYEVARTAAQALIIDKKETH